MDVPLEIRFHNIDKSDAVEALVRERAEKLNRIFDRLTSCRVAVEAPHRNHRKGNQYVVTINLGVPGGDLMVNREPHHPKERYANPDVYKALREAFDAAERQLKDYKARLRGEVKPQIDSFLGRVNLVMPEEDHGFLTTATGTSLYFHRNAVLSNDFDDLQPGDAVHYTEIVGDTGPIAHKVWSAEAQSEH